MKETLDNPQQIWQSQPVEGTKMSVEVIRLRAGRFERKISRRNLRESIAGLGVIALFLYYFATAHDTAYRVTWGLFIAGMIWLIVQLQRKGTPKSMPADIGSSTCLELFRSELERQRDLVKDYWTWYIVPLFPGYVALNVAYVLNFPRSLRWLSLGVMDAFFVGMFVLLWKLNLHAARCLQRSIDELKAAESSS